MRKALFAMAIIGFTAPAILTSAYMQEHPDNFLFLGNPTKTWDVMFGTWGRAAFSADLLWVMIVFSCWVLLEGKRLGIQRAWVFIPIAATDPPGHPASR